MQTKRRTKTKNPIRAARIAAGLTQSELAKRIGVERATISGYEAGRFGASSTAALKLCEQLPGLTLDAIFGRAA